MNGTHRLAQVPPGVQCFVGAEARRRRRVEETILSAYSMTYALPEQPDVRTPRRNPSPLPRFSMNFRTRSAAAWVMVIAISVSLRNPSDSGGVRLRALAGFRLVIAEARDDPRNGDGGLVFRRGKLVRKVGRPSLEGSLVGRKGMVGHV